MEYRNAQALAEIFNAVAHPVRIMILKELSAGDVCVCDLHKRLPVAQSNVSRHLGVLKKAGIVQDYRNGQRVFYHLQTPCILRAFECAVGVLRTERKRRLEEMKGAVA